MRLKDKYKKEITPALQKEFGYKNSQLVPRLEKVVLNVGFGHHSKEKEFMESVARGLTTLSGQKAVFTKAKNLFQLLRLEKV